MARMYKSGDAYHRSFSISSSTGAATNADSTPTGTLYVNGVSNAATVTISNPATGLYHASATLPGAAGDVVELAISATVGGVATKDFVDSIRLVGFDSTPAALAAVLAAAQPNYAPAKAGDAMILTAAYDAAKSAAPPAGTVASAVWAESSRSLTDKSGFSGTATNFAAAPSTLAIADAVDAALSTAHGAGSWAGGGEIDPEVIEDACAAAIVAANLPTKPELLTGSDLTGALAATPVTLANASVTTAKFATITPGKAGFLERLLLLTHRLMPVAGGSVTSPKSGNGDMVIKGTGGATLASFPVTDNGTIQALGGS